MHKPEPGEYAQSPYVSRYIEQVGDAPVLEVLARQFGEMTQPSTGSASSATVLAMPANPTQWRWMHVSCERRADPCHDFLLRGTGIDDQHPGILIDD